MRYMGAYLGVGACPGHYGTNLVPKIVEFFIHVLTTGDASQNIVTNFTWKSVENA